MATMKDIARETGLGLATISKYINGGHVLDKNKAAIDDAIEKLGFTVNEVARGLKTSRTRTIGVVIPELSNLFITSIITAMEDVLRRRGYAVITCDCRSDPAQECEVVRFLLGKRVDGIINMPTSMDGAHLLPALDAGVPVLLVDRMIPAIREHVSAVLVDNVGASAGVVRTLIAAGHRDIGILLGPRDVFTSQQRRLGYSQVLTDNGLLLRESRIFYCDYTVQGGYEGMRRLLAMDSRPTAVYITNYEITLGAIIAINEMGVRIPGQLSLIGFDNMQLSQVVRPRLTTVSQPLELIGEKAADLILRRLEGGPDEGEPRIITLSTEIRHGDSVKQL